MATLLPVPEVQWIDSNGAPLASGLVYFYVPNTSTPKDTYRDSGGTLLNTNPVILDAAGRAIVYGSGVYRCVVYDASGNLVYDQATADTAVGGLASGGTSTGTPNAQVISASSFTQQNEQQITFIVGAGLTNTGSATVAPGGGSGIAVLKDTATGPTALSGGEMVAGNVVTLVYDATRGAFHIVQTSLAGIFVSPTISNLTVTGSFTATGLVSNFALSNMADSTVKGRNVGSGLGRPLDLTPTQLTAIPNAVVGDSGSGGTQGMVPAPPPGSASVNEFLHANGTFVRAQPAVTSSTLPIGTFILGYNNSGGTIADGGTIAGSNLKRVAFSASTPVGGVAVTGTWQNVSGDNVLVNNGGYFSRIS